MASTPSGPTNVGVAPNVGGLLCYLPCCVGLIFSIVVAIVEKQSRFVRFHAFQSLLFHAVAIVVGLGFQVFQIVLGLTGLGVVISILLTLVGGVLGLALLGLDIFLMVKAYNNEEFMLPVAGELAKKWAQELPAN